MDDVDKIKQKIDIVQLISEYVPLKKTGRNYKSPCPFHNEKTPSFIVSPERQIWHCFGCGAGGDVFKFLMMRENMEFVEALRVLAQKAGVTLTQKFDSGASKTKERIYQMNHLASKYYHYLLLHHQAGKKALDYITGRGIKEKSLETFKIGYAPNSWDSLMKFLLSKGFNKEEMALAGLILKSDRGSDYYDRFRNRLIFTLKDHRGNVVAFAGRALGADVKEAKYINTAETPVYIKGDVLYGLDVTREAIKKANQAIIVEGEIDLISSWQTGATNVVAIKGSAFTQNQVELLKRFTPNILLALDADLAGDLAARRGITNAETAGLNIKVIIIPQGKDPADCIRNNPLDWKKAIDKAVSIYDFYLQTALKKYDAATAEGKKQISEEVLPFLSQIENLVVQAHYVKQLAKSLDVSEELLYSQMKKMIKEEKREISPTKETDKTVKMTRREILESFILGSLLQSDSKQTINAYIGSAFKEFQLPAQQKIARQIKTYLENHGEWDIKSFTEILPQELIGVFDVCFLWDIDTNKEFEKDLTKALSELKSLNLRERLGKISQIIKTVKEEKELNRLSREFADVSQKLRVLEKEMS